MPRAREHADSALARWRRGRGRLVALALTAALALLGTPLRGALRAACDLCPPDCPMHDGANGAAPDHRADAQRPRMRCHNAAPGGRDAVPAGQARFSKPSCGSHVALVGFDTGPMLPAGPLAWRVAPGQRAASADRCPAAGRISDPPETPPPVLRA
jgi:hypothetical protein